MNLIYATLGAIARFTERMSRTRGNGVPMSWLILFLVVVMAVVSGVKFKEALTNRGQPRVVTLADLLAGDGMDDAHVTVSGDFVREGALEQKGDDKDAKPKAVYLPLVDRERAIYVSFSGPGPAEREMVRDGKVTGMVRRMDKELQDHIQQSGAGPGAAVVDTRYVLMAGETPANPVPWGAALGASVLLALAMLLAILKRYVIFRRTRPAAAAAAANPLGPTPLRPMAAAAAAAPTAPAEPPPPVPQGMRVSGRFAFEQNPKLRKRFLDVPALLAEMASGDVGLVSRIDASVRFYGQVTKDRNGIWAVVMKAGTGTPPEEGLLYNGFRPRPALRIGYVDATTGRPATAVLSFPDEAARAAIRAQLAAGPTVTA